MNFSATPHAFINEIVSPAVPYSALVAPLVLAGVGVSMAMPAAQNAILSSVAVAEMGKASGVFNMGRFLGGMFGIAALVAIFSANGGVDSAAHFESGFAANDHIPEAAADRRWPRADPTNHGSQAELMLLQ